MHFREYSDKDVYELELALGLLLVGHDLLVVGHQQLQDAEGEKVVGHQRCWDSRPDQHSQPHREPPEGNERVEETSGVPVVYGLYGLYYR